LVESPAQHANLGYREAVPESTSATRLAHIRESLRSDILRGVLAPGTALRLAPLAERFGVSMSAVREALGQLSQGGLAVLSPNQGFRVVEISRADLTAITELRVMVEARALEHSIRLGDSQWEASVVAAHHVLGRATFRLDGAPGSTEEWSEAHAAFHDSLVAACGNPRMLAIVRSLWDGAELYRQLSGTSRHGSERDIAAEHTELMHLATTRDTAAIAALVRHLERTTDDLLESDLLP
jgi:DNA-binding GntR family transcriptional regulator